MKVAVVYATPRRQFWMTVRAAGWGHGQRCDRAVDCSEAVPGRRPGAAKGRRVRKVTTLDAVLSDGDRIEIYRPLTVDPKTVKQKAKPGKSDSGDAE